MGCKMKFLFLRPNGQFSSILIIVSPPIPAITISVIGSVSGILFKPSEIISFVFSLTPYFSAVRLAYSRGFSAMSEAIAISHFPLCIRYAGKYPWSVPMSQI